jgi:hypothetical protein
MGGVCRRKASCEYHRHSEHAQQKAAMRRHGGNLISGRQDAQGRGLDLETAEGTAGD